MPRWLLLLSLATTGTLVLGMTTIGSHSPSVAAPSIPNPISLYKFDEPNGSTSITDSVRGAAGLGTVYGSPIFTAGKVDNAMCLNGSSQYATAPLVGNGLTEFTLSAWVKLDARTTWATIVKNWGDASYGAFHLGLDGNNGYWSNYVGTVNPNGQPSVNSGPTLAIVNDWQYVVTTVSQSQGKAVLYLNGVKVDEESFSGTVANFRNVMSFGVKLDDNQAGIAPVNQGWLDGCLDEIAFWNVALSQEQVQEINNSGGGVPDPEPQPSPSPTPSPNPSPESDAVAELARTGSTSHLPWAAAVLIVFAGTLTVFASGRRLLYGREESWRNLNRD